MNDVTQSALRYALTDVLDSACRWLEYPCECTPPAMCVSCAVLEHLERREDHLRLLLRGLGDGA